MESKLIALIIIFINCVIDFYNYFIYNLNKQPFKQKGII